MKRRGSQKKGKMKGREKGEGDDEKVRREGDGGEGR